MSLTDEALMWIGKIKAANTVAELQAVHQEAEAYYTTHPRIDDTVDGHAVSGAFGHRMSQLRRLEAFKERTEKRA